MFGIENLEYIEKNGYAQKPAVRFCTRIFDLENELPKNTKIVPDWLLDKLDEKGIAIWLMDDGSIHNKNNNNYISIHTNSYDLETHYKFVENLKI